MKILSYLLFLTLIISCGKNEAEPIKLNTDGCDYCKMKIADGKFGAELITAKGRVYKFDDMQCMISYHKENESTQIAGFYIHDYNQDNTLIAAENAYYVSGGEINSPMRGNIIAVKTEKEAAELASKLNANSTSWSEIIK